MPKGRTLVFVQWAVSIALVCYLGSKIDLEDSLRALKNANELLLVFSVVQLALQPLLGALRWQLIVHALGAEIKFMPALRLVWIGTFFSQALPGVIGGDVVRIWLYWREGAGHRLAINSVALGTVIMMASLFLLVAALQPGLVARSKSAFASWLPLLMFVAAIFGLIILMSSDRLVQGFCHWRAFRGISYLAVDSRKAFLHPFVCTAIVALSILAYLNMSITVWLIAKALQLAVSLPDCFVLVPVAVLAAIIPVSVGGWGVREGAIIVLFGAIGVSFADALALSVLFGLAGILVSAPGIVFWLMTGYRRSDVLQATALATGETTRE